jgi:hypothetical protein
MLQQHAFEQALIQAAEMGLAGTAATQFANQAAASVPTSGVAAGLSSYLPYIGAGLAAYNAVTGKIHGGDQALLAAATVATAWNPALWPAMAFFAVPMMLNRPDVDNHVYVHNPELEVVHVDQEGNYYLYDTSTQTEKNKCFVEEMNHADDHGNLGRGSLIKFNPETNKITRGHIGLVHDTKGARGRGTKGTIMLTLEQTRELFASGVVEVPYEKYDKEKKGYIQTTEKIYLNPETDEEFNARVVAMKADGTFQKGREPSQRKKGFIRWHSPDSFNPEIKFMGGRGASGMYNVRALQAELYNKVLLPNGLVPPVPWEPITIGDVEYLMDPSGTVATTDGMIVGSTDLETGQVSSIQSRGRLKYNSKGRIRGGQENPIIGMVDQLPPADFFQTPTPPTDGVTGLDDPNQPLWPEETTDGLAPPSWTDDPTLWEEEPDDRIRVGPGTNNFTSPGLRNRIILGQGPDRQASPQQALQQTLQEDKNMALPPFLQRFMQQQQGPRTMNPQNMGGVNAGPGRPGVNVGPGGPQPINTPGPGGPQTMNPQNMGGVNTGPGGPEQIMSLLGGGPKNKSSLEAVLSILRQLVNSGQLR